MDMSQYSKTREACEKAGLPLLDHFHYLSFGSGGILNLLEVSSTSQLNAIKEHDLFIHCSVSRKVYIFESNDWRWRRSDLRGSTPERFEVAMEVWPNFPKQLFSALVIELAIKAALAPTSTYATRRAGY